MARKNVADDELRIYALAAGRLPQRMRVNGHVLRVFSIGGIAVIAETVTTEPASFEKALRDQHATVVSLADRVDPLLPARFGSTVPASRLEAVIRRSSELLLEALEHVRGRYQMTVRITGGPATDNSSSVATTGTTYLAGRQAAHAVPIEAAPLRAALAKVVVDERVQPGRGDIRVTLFHLIHRRDSERYLGAVKRAAPSIMPWRAKVSGPWPPFAFAPERLE